MDHLYRKKCVVRIKIETAYFSNETGYPHKNDASRSNTVKSKILANLRHISVWTIIFVSLLYIKESTT